MSEAFGSPAEAGDHESAVEGRGDRKLLVPSMRRARESDKREVDRPPMRNCMGGIGQDQKKRAPSEDGALQKWGKRTREEETPFAVGPNRGRRVRFGPCREMRDRGRRVRCGVSSTSRI